MWGQLGAADGLCAALALGRRVWAGDWAGVCHCLPNLDVILCRDTGCQQDLAMWSRTLMPGMEVTAPAGNFVCSVDKPCWAHLTARPQSVRTIATARLLLLLWANLQFSISCWLFVYLFKLFFIFCRASVLRKNGQDPTSKDILPCCSFPSLPSDFGWHPASSHGQSTTPENVTRYVSQTA